MDMPGKMKRFRQSHFRAKQHSPIDKKFSIAWVNNMANRQSEKRIAELCTEFLLTHHKLKEEMAIEFKKQLREVEENLRNNMLLMETRLAAICLQQRMKDCMGNTDLEDEMTVTSSSSETGSDIDQQSRKLTKRQIAYITRYTFDAYSGSDSSDDDVCYKKSWKLPSGSPCDFQPAARDIYKDERCLLHDPAKCGTNQLLKKSKRSQSFKILMARNQKCEERRVTIENVNDKDNLLMERQWNKWVDKNDAIESHEKGETELGKGESIPKVLTSAITRRLKPGQMSINKTFRKKISDYFSLHTTCKYEKLEEDED